MMEMAVVLLRMEMVRVSQPHRREEEDDRTLVSDGAVLDEAPSSFGKELDKSKQILFYQKMRAGFQNVAQNLSSSSSSSNHPNTTSAFHDRESITSFATVNFIDYTSTSNTMSSSTAKSKVRPHRPVWNRTSSTSRRRIFTNP